MADRTALFVAPLPGTTPQGTSPTDGRLVLGSLFGTGGGRLRSNGFSISSTAMQVGMFETVWRIPDPTNALGVYLAPADTAVLTFSAGPASGSRKDVLWVRQNNYEAGDVNSRVVYGVAAGTAAATPVEPSVPAGAMKIGVLTVPAGATTASACTLVETYPSAVLPPALTATTKARLDAVAGQFSGQRALVGDLEYLWGGSAWLLQPTARTMCHVAYNNPTADGNVGANTWAAMSYDTAVYDPYSIWSGTGNAGTFTFPWSGRYTLDARWSPRNSSSQRVWNELYAASFELGRVAVLSAAALTPVSYHYELVASANVTFQHRIQFEGAANAVAGTGNLQDRPELILRYLGPA